MRVFVFRQDKLKDIVKIVCQHNGPIDGRITLFGAFVFGNKGHEDYHKVYRINRDIAKEPREIKVLATDDNQKQEETNHLKSLESFPIHLSFLELIWILSVNISVISLLVHYIMVGLLTKQTVLHMLITMLMAGAIGSLFNLILIKIYKALIRGELKQKTLMNSSSENVYFLLIKAFVILTIVASVVIDILLIWIRAQRKDIETFRWLCIVFAATTIVVLLWNIGSHLSFGKKGQPSEPLSIDDSSSLMSVNSEKQ